MAPQRSQPAGPAVSEVPAGFHDRAPASRGTTLLQVLALSIATLIAFANAGHDRLVHDDEYLTPESLGTEFVSPLRYFREDLWAAQGLETGFYRPLFQLSIFFDHRLAGDWYAAQHWMNIGWHLLTVLAVFGFLRQWLRVAIPAPDGQRLDAGHCAFLAALVFAVHPVHSEVVSQLYNRSETLVALAGALGLWALLRHLDSRPVRAWLAMTVATAFAVFSKESGLMLPVIAGALALLVTPWQPRVLWRRMWPAVLLLIPLAVYFVLRHAALGMPAETVLDAAAALPASSPALTLPGSKVWLRASGMWAEGLRVLIWPHPLRLHYQTPADLVQWLSVPLHLGLLGLAVYRRWRGHPGLLAGLVVYYLALLPASRLFFSAGEYPHTAERYLYLASIGLSVWLATVLCQSTLNWPRRAPAALALVVLVICWPLCWQRNADWTDNLALYEAEYRRGGHDANTLRLLVAARLVARDDQGAAALCDRHRDVLEQEGRLGNNCGLAYNRVGRPMDAQAAFLIATHHAASRTQAHLNLGQLYLAQGHTDAAQAQFDRAIGSEDDPAQRDYLSAVSLALMHPNDRDQLERARGHLEQALRLRPNLAPARTLLAAIDEALARSR